MLRTMPKEGRSYLTLRTMPKEGRSYLTLRTMPKEGRSYLTLRTMPKGSATSTAVGRTGGRRRFFMPISACKGAVIPSNAALWIYSFQAAETQGALQT